MALTKEKILQGTELLGNGDLRSIYKIKVYDNGALVSEYRHIETVDNKEQQRIKDICGEVALQQLKQINDKHDEISRLKEEKAVLLSEKQALFDELEVHKAEKVEVELNLKGK